MQHLANSSAPMRESLIPCISQYQDAAINPGAPTSTMVPLGRVDMGEGRILRSAFGVAACVAVGCTGHAPVATATQTWKPVGYEALSVLGWLNSKENADTPTDGCWCRVRNGVRSLPAV